jgi:hypothetical protein
MTQPSSSQLDISALVEEMACDYGRQWAASVQARMVIRKQAEQLAAYASEKPAEGGS